MSKDRVGDRFAALNLFDDEGQAAMDVEMEMDVGFGVDGLGESGDVSLLDTDSARFGGSVSPNRTDNFDLETGQFRGPDGAFEPGGPPPDFSQSADRFRSTETGQFKDRPQDHFDEPLEVAFDDLSYKG